MHLVCLDLEGVLTPEIWIAVAEQTGRPELRRTTRDEPDYDRLMRYRLGLLDQHGITLPAIQEVIGTLRPLDGAREFLDWLRARVPLVILSDTFAQFAAPLLRQLGEPLLLCHELEVAPGGRITGYRLRQPDQKRRAVEAFRGLNYDIVAAGDSHNDLSMLQAAHAGILFRPTAAFAAAHPEFPVTQDHPALRAEIEKFLAAPSA
jgi:phosphoserine/homoserine phosphotransferase